MRHLAIRLRDACMACSANENEHVVNSYWKCHLDVLLSCRIWRKGMRRKEWLFVRRNCIWTLRNVASVDVESLEAYDVAKSFSPLPKLQLPSNLHSKCQSYAKIQMILSYSTYSN